MSQPESSASAAPDAPGRGSLLVIFLTVFVDLLGFGMVLPLLPVYARHLTADLSDAQQGWVIGALMASFSAMQFIFAPLWGRLSDRVGRRPVLMIGLAGSVLCYALFGIATIARSLTGLFIARIGAGICGATIATAQAYIADTTSLTNRARGMALIGAAFGLGFTCGPLIGALGLISAGARELDAWPGFIAAGLSALALVLAIFLLPESLRKTNATTHRKWIAMRGVREAAATPSVGILVAALFISVFSFANFESTLALLLDAEPEHGGFGFLNWQILLAFAFIGLVLSFAQGFLVRRLATRVSEGALAATGTVISMLGFVLLALASERSSLALLFAAMGIQVVGFALVTPALHSLISRRSHPARQGSILGVAQSAASLARIAGPVYGIRLFKEIPTLPSLSAAAIMVIALILVVVGYRGGGDYGADAGQKNDHGDTEDTEKKDEST